MSSKSDFNTPVIVLVGVVTTILTIAVILAVHVLYYTVSQQEYQRKVVAAGTAESDTKLAEQEAKLTRYAWTDKANGITVIPIERAMELVVRDGGVAPVKPETSPETPAEESVAPTKEPTIPAEEPAAPVEEPAAPVEEPAAPAEEPMVPVEDPAEKPAEPAAEGAAPAEPVGDAAEETPPAASPDADAPEPTEPNAEPAEAEAPEEEQSDEG